MPKAFIVTMISPHSSKSPLSESSYASHRRSRFWVWVATVIGLGVPLVCFWWALRVLFGFGPVRTSFVPVHPNGVPTRDYELAVFLAIAVAPLLIYLAMRLRSRRRR
jgi:hypothetical protein